MSASVKVRADAAQRAMRAWTARVCGATWQEAAQIAGFTDQHNAIRAVSNYFGSLPSPELSDLRHLWRPRCELLWAQAVIDIREQRPGAITAGVRVTERAAKLDGLDAPTTSVHVDASEALTMFLERLDSLPAYVPPTTVEVTE